MRVIKLMADYQCFPLWEVDEGGSRNVSPADLPLSDALRTALLAWASQYDQTLCQEYPAQSGFSTPALARAFESEGRRLWERLRQELGSSYNVIYYSDCNRRLVE